MSETRKPAAIVVADVVGYSRLAGADEDRTLARLRSLRSDLIDPAVAVNHGRIVKRTGDGVIAEFLSVVDAVRCAIEVQNGMVERNAGLPPERRGGAGKNQPDLCGGCGQQEAGKGHRAEVASRPGARVREYSASAFPVVDEHALCRSGHFITFDDDRRRIERQLE